MRYLVRVRSLQIGLLLWVGGTIASVVLAGALVPIFSLFLSGFGRVPAALLLPTVTAVGILAANAVVGPAELGAVRPVPVWRRATVVVSCVLTCTVSWGGLGLSQPAGDGDVLSLVISRNVLLLVGLGLLARRVLGAGGSTIVPVVYVLAAMVFGNRTRRTWDFVLSDAVPPQHLLVAGAVFAIGVLIGCSRQADRRVARVS